MKYTNSIFYLIIFLSTVFIGCQGKIDVKKIPLTSTSEEAKTAFFEGIYRYDQNEVDESNAAFKRALELDPNFELVKLYYDTKSPEQNRNNIIEAYNNREKVSEVEKGLIEAEYQLRIYGDLSQCINVLKSVIEKYPDIPYLYELTAYRQSFNKDFDDAITNWKKGLELNPNSYFSALGLGLLHITVGSEFRYMPEDRIDLDEAESWLKLAQSIRPNASATPRFLGNLYRAKYDLESALKSYETAVNMNTEKTSMLMEQTLMLAHTHTAMGNYEIAREYYEKTIDLSINDAWVAINNTYYTFSLLYEKKYDDAIKRLSEAELKVDGLSGDREVIEWGKNRLEFIKFLAFGHSQRIEETKISLGKLDDFADRQAKTRLERSVDELERKNIERGLKVGKLFRSSWFNILFGNYEIAQSQLDTMYEIQNTRIEKNPDALNGYYNLSGYLNLMQGNVEESISMYDKVLERGDLDEYNRYFYALALKAVGELDKSKQIFTELANNPFANWQIAMVKNLAKAQIKTNI